MDFTPDTVSIDGVLILTATAAVGWRGGIWLWSFVTGLIGKAASNIGKGSAPNPPVA